MIVRFLNGLEQTTTNLISFFITTARIPAYLFPGILAVRYVFKLKNYQTQFAVRIRAKINLQIVSIRAPAR